MIQKRRSNTINVGTCTVMYGAGSVAVTSYTFSNIALAYIFSYTSRLSRSFPKTPNLLFVNSNFILWGCNSVPDFIWPATIADSASTVRVPVVACLLRLTGTLPCCSCCIGEMLVFCFLVGLPCNARCRRIPSNSHPPSVNYWISTSPIISLSPISREK